MMKELPYTRTDHFQSLPLAKNTQGEERLCGFEFEYTGVAIKQCAELLAKQFEGGVNRENDLTFRILDSSIGTIKVEADWQLAKKIADKDLNELPKPLDRMIRKSIKQYSEVPTLFIPLEIVTDPLRQNQFGSMEELRDLLLQHKAKGTSESFSFAFGTHINCQVPSTSVEAVLDYLRAFLIAYPFLMRELNVNPTRRLLSFIDPFPREYAVRVLDPDYRPDWKVFIRDYIRFNNTRNRALDLFPLIVHLFPDSKEQISSSCRSLVKSRPAFHYRLPNCDFGNPDWRVSSAWNSWVAVERLAFDKKNLAQLARQRYQQLRHPFRSWFVSQFQAISNFLSQ